MLEYKFDLIWHAFSDNEDLMNAAARHIVMTSFQYRTDIVPRRIPNDDQV